MWMSRGSMPEMEEDLLKVEAFVENITWFTRPASKKSAWTNAGKIKRRTQSGYRLKSGNIAQNSGRPRIWSHFLIGSRKITSQSVVIYWCSVTTWSCRSHSNTSHLWKSIQLIKALNVVRWELLHQFGGLESHKEFVKQSRNVMRQGSVEEARTT